MTGEPIGQNILIAEYVGGPAGCGVCIGLPLRVETAHPVDVHGRLAEQELVGRAIDT